jgi:hypothetical protein
MRRLLMAVAVIPLIGVLVAAGFGATPTYNGPATRAAALADRHAHITAPDKTQTVIGKPVTRFEFRLTRNTGELAVYRTHTNAVTALSQGEALAKAFGQTLTDLAAVHGNVIIGFNKRPTSGERAETQDWLRTH